MVDFDINIKLTAQNAARAIANIEGGLRDVERQASSAENALNDMGDSVRTINKIEKELKSVEDALRDVEVGSDAFKKLAGDAKKLDGELEGARRSIRGVGDEVESAGGKFSAFGEIAKGALMRLGEIGIEAIGAGIQAAAGFVADSIGVYQRYEDSLTTIQAQIQATGGAAGITAGEIENLAKSISANTQSSTTDVLEASQILLAYTNVTGDLFEETIRLSGDFMTALKPITGDELPDAVERLGEALQSPIAGLEGLEEAKIYFTESEKEVIKAMEESGQLAEAQRIILDKVTESMDGLAIAAGETTTGSIEAMNNAIEDLQLALGQSLAPVIQAGAEFLAEFVTELMGATDGADGMKTAAQQLAEQIKAVDVSKLVDDLGRLLNMAEQTSQAVGDLAKAIVEVSKATPVGALVNVTAGLAGRVYGNSQTTTPNETRAAQIAGRPSARGRSAFSTGGLVGGSGGSTADDRLIQVSSGEYVIRADAVDKLGKQYLDALNSGALKLGELMPSEASLTPQQTTTTTSSAGSQGVYWQGNIGPTSTGAHFDVKRSDRGYFDRAMLDQYTNITGGRELSQGLTVAGGRFGASRSYGSHQGWDFAFGGQAGLTLENGAVWLDSKSTQHGDKARFQIPTGEIFEILHGKFNGDAAMGGGTSSTTGVSEAEKERVKQQQELAKAVESATDQIQRQTERLAENVAQSKLDNEVLSLELSLLKETNGETGDAIKLLEMQVEQSAELAKFTQELNEKVAAKLITEDEQNMTLEKFKELQGQKLEALKEELSLLDNIDSLKSFNDEWERYTDSARDSMDAIADRIAMIEQETALVQSGAEDYDDALKLIQAEMQVKAELAEIQEQLNEQLDRGNISEEKYSETLNDAQTLAQQKLESINAEIEATGRLTTAQEIQRAEMERQAEIQQQYQQIIDNATGAFTNFATSIISGSASAGEAVKNLATTILSNLANQAFSSLFGNLFGGLLGGGGGSPIKLFADGGVVDKPTNAIIGEAGAEAVIPLKNGKVPVDLPGGGKGAGTTNITVNVTSSGGTEDGRALGRQISEAIKAEMANQRRSGGLLR